MLQMSEYFEGVKAGLRKGGTLSVLLRTMRFPDFTMHGNYSFSLLRSCNRIPCFKNDEYVNL